MSRQGRTAAPMRLATIKSTVREGTVWLMTNHRHTVDGHTPAPPRLVKCVHVTASGSSFHIVSADSEDGGDLPSGPAIIKWPIAARVGYDAGTGTIRLYGPAGDRSDPRLTLMPVRPAAALPDDRGFYRQVIQLEILSCGRVDPGQLDSLDGIRYEITEGHWSGNITTVAVNEQVTADRMAELLRAQRSDEDFLLPADDDGTEMCACPRAGAEPHVPAPLPGVRLPAARHDRELPALRRADRAQCRRPVGDHRDRHPDRVRGGSRPRAPPGTPPVGRDGRGRHVQLPGTRSRRVR